MNPLLIEICHSFVFLCMSPCPRRSTVFSYQTKSGFHALEILSNPRLVRPSRLPLDQQTSLLLSLLLNPPIKAGPLLVYVLTAQFGYLPSALRPLDNSLGGGPICPDPGTGRVEHPGNISTDGIRSRRPICVRPLFNINFFYQKA